MEVNNLKAYLANIRMSQREFGEIVDVTENYISSIIHGKRTPSARLAKDILQATGGLIRLNTRVRKKNQKCENSQNEEQQAFAV